MYAEVSEVMIIVVDDDRQTIRPQVCGWQTKTLYLRKCRNWQTSKTKDLVIAISCGFKSHLPQWVIQIREYILDLYFFEYPISLSRQ